MSLPAVASAAPAKAKAVSCFGKKPTITVNGTRKTVRVPKNAKGVVVYAMGKGDRVYANNNGDRICVGAASSVTGGNGNDSIQFTSGTIHGGKGNDTLKQVGKGNANVYGDAGNDKINLDKGNSVAHGGDGNDELSAGSSGNQKLYGDAGRDTFYSGSANVTIDGGADPDTIHVGGSQQANTVVVPGVDDTVNGVPVRIDAPLSAPSALLSFNGETGAAHVAVDSLQSAISPGAGAELQLADALAPPGRSLVAWTADFGDGSVVTGPGAPPLTLAHDYVTEGVHTIVVRLTDSAGKTTTLTEPVAVTKPPSVHVAMSRSGATVTYTLTVAQDPGFSSVASWYFYFGDNTPEATGVGAPPATITHTYAPGTYDALFSVESDQKLGGLDISGAFTISDGAVHPNLVISHAAPDANGAQAASAYTPVVETGESVGFGVGSSINTDGSQVPFVLDYGDGSNSGYQSASANHNLSHTYSTPGVKTVTLTLQTGGNPSVSENVTVVPGSTVARLSVPAISPEGLTTVYTTGTTATPGTSIATWELEGPEGLFLQGSGLPPATVTQNLAGAVGDGTYELYVIDTMGRSSDVSASHVSTANHPVISSFGAADGDYQVEVASPTPNLTVAASLSPSYGQRLTGASLNFGDGTVVADPTGAEAGSLVADPHTYATPGNYVASLTATDSSGQRVSRTLTVSVAGAPSVTVTSPAATVAAGQTVAFTVAASPGANANTIGWVADFGDGTPDVGGYGPVPSTLAHTFATASDRMSFTILTDHESTATGRVDL